MTPCVYNVPLSELTQRVPYVRVDFTVANHVHLIEPHWNPMVEAQAVDRVHRIGQEREVVITRYIMRNSVETVNSKYDPLR